MLSFRFDLFNLGVALIEWISSDVMDSISKASHFERFQEGQQANLAVREDIAEDSRAAVNHISG